MTTADEWGRFSKFVTYLWEGGKCSNFFFLSPDYTSNLVQWVNVNDIKEPNLGMGRWHQYFSVHPTTLMGGLHTRTSKDTVASIRCLFGEFDAKDEVLPDEYGPYLPDDYDNLKPFEQRTAVKKAQEQAMMLDLPTYKARARASVAACPLPPSLVVDSGGGYQPYWLLRDPVPVDDSNREQIEKLQADWVTKIGADTGAKDLARVLRIPGSLNMKDYFAPDYPVVTIVSANTHLRYELSDFGDLTVLDEAMVAAQKAAPPDRKNNDPVIAEWNSTAAVGAVLAEYGYTLRNTYKDVQRYVRPGGKSASVVVFTDTNRSYHHSSGDLLHCNGHSRDAFDVYTELEHNGDASAAYEDVKRQLGKWEEQTEVDISGQEAKASEATDEGTDEDAILLEWPVHDHGNASVVKALYPNGFGFCDALGWMANVGTHYETENAVAAVNRAITATLIRRRLAAVKAEREDVVKGTTPSASRKNAVKDMYKDLVTVSLGEFDSDPNVLNCANGVVDLRTGELVAHGPSNKFTYCVSTPFVPGTVSELWNTFLADTIADYDQIADWMQMVRGYLLTGLTREEVLFYLYGPPRGGKGTLTHTLLTLLGSPLARGVNFNTLTSKRDGDTQNFDLAPLRPARLIAASESGRYSSLNESVVKNITGNDPITAAFKHRDVFTYQPQFKILLSSNHPAKGDVDDDGFWSRINSIKCPNSRLGIEDKSLKWRMASPENLVGVLADAVEGARRWYASPTGLVTPKAVKDETQKHRDDLDYVQQWIEQCTEPNIGGGEANSRLYKSYENWCEENGHTPKKAAAFGRSLEAKGYEACNVKIAGNSMRGRRNLLVTGNTSKEVEVDG